MASNSESIMGVRGEAPNGSKGEALVGGLRDEVPQKLKTFKNKLNFLCISFW